jgi:hypothetical protein
MLINHRIAASPSIGAPLKLENREWQPTFCAFCALRQIRNPQSEIRNPQSEIRNAQFPPLLIHLYMSALCSKQ